VVRLFYYFRRFFLYSVRYIAVFKIQYHPAREAFAYQPAEELDYLLESHK
jgi:hypothetical protein